MGKQELHYVLKCMAAAHLHLHRLRVQIAHQHAVLCAVPANVFAADVSAMPLALRDLEWEWILSVQRRKWVRQEEARSSLCCSTTGNVWHHVLLLAKPPRRYVGVQF
jgi:hypothetical protein